MTPMTTDQQREAVARITTLAANLKASTGGFSHAIQGIYALDAHWPGHALARDLDAILSHLAPQVETKCFECETDLIGPLCPKCNPERAPQVEGWVLVPREPTQAMALQGWLKFPRLHPALTTGLVRSIWAAMLSSAPPPLVGGCCSASAESKWTGPNSPPSAAQHSAGGGEA